MNPKLLFHPVSLLPPVTLILTGIMAVFTGYMYLFQTDATSVDGVYTTLLLKEGPLSLLFILLMTLFTLLLVLAPLVLMLQTDPREDVLDEKQSTGMIFARICAGVTMAATTLVYFLLSPAATPYERTPENSSIVLFSLLCAVVGTLYFILPVFAPFKKRILSFFLGVFALLFLGCELLLTHYYMLDFLSSPTRVFAIFGYGSLILFLLFDLKRLVPGRSSERCRIAFALAAFFLNMTDALPRMILSFAEQGGFEVTLTSFHTLLRMLLSVYALLSVLPRLSAKNISRVLSELYEEYEPFEEETEAEEGKGEEKATGEDSASEVKSAEEESAEKSSMRESTDSSVKEDAQVPREDALTQEQADSVPKNEDDSKE